MATRSSKDIHVTVMNDKWQENGPNFPNPPRKNAGDQANLHFSLKNKKQNIGAGKRRWSPLGAWQ